MKIIYCRFCRYEVSAKRERDALDALSLHVADVHPVEWDQIAQMLAHATARLKTFTDVVEETEGVWTVEEHSANVNLPVDTTREEVI